MAHDIFISYATADVTVAQMVCATLEKQGIRCWMAPRDVQPGEEWARAIVEAIKASRAMVLVFSGAANDSGHVARELDRAIDREIPIVPVRIENVEPSGSLEFSLSSVHWLDAISPPIEAHIVKLADRLRTMIERPAKASPLPPPMPVPENQAVQGAVGGPATAAPVIGSAPAQTPATPTASRSLLTAGMVIAAMVVMAGIIVVRNSLVHQQPAAGTSAAQGSATPTPTGAPAETFHPDPDTVWHVFESHDRGDGKIYLGEMADLKRKSAAHPDDEKPALMLALYYYDAGRYDDAIYWFRYALGLVPKHVDARIDLALAYWRTQRDEEAAAQLQRVLEIEPRNTLALLNMGVVHATAGRFDLAAGSWRHVIEYQRGTTEADRARELLDKLRAR